MKALPFVLGLLVFGALAQAPRYSASEIWIMNTDGTGLRRLTTNPAADEEPEFSPDGKWIAFDSDRDGNRDIYVTDLEGANLQNITRNPAKEDHAAWSPDGKQIAFQYQESERIFVTDVFVMNADGSARRRLTDSGPKSRELAAAPSKGEPPTRNGWPNWSPDGARIVFSSTRDGQREIYIMNKDGSNQKRLTFGSAGKGSTDPTFSSDGKFIAFSSTRDGNEEIYVMNADGSGQRRLTSNETIDTRPCWSLDGREIAFCSRREQTFEVWIMQSDGSMPRRITRTKGYSGRPNWSPNGKQIVFERRDVLE